MYEDYYGFGKARVGEPSSTGARWASYRGAGPAKVTMGLLGAGLLWHLALLVGKLVAQRFFAGEAMSVASTLVTVGLLAATGIAFLVWFYRAYHVVHVAEGTANPPNQAVWTFFVPILNLFRPYQIATEIWRKTGPVEGMGHSPLIIVWWVLWCAGRMCPFWLGTHIVYRADQMAQPMFIGMGVAELALAGAAIAVVRTLDGRIRSLQGETTAPATF